MILSAAVDIRADRRHQTNLAKAMAENLASILAQHVDALIATAYVEIEHIESDTARRGDTVAVQASLVRSARLNPMLSGFALFDAAGQPMHGVGRVSSLMTDGGPLPVAPSGVVPAGPDGLMRIWKAQRNAGADIVGYVVAFMEPNALERVVQLFDVGANGTATLWRRDGTLLVRHPMRAGDAGEVFRIEGIGVEDGPRAVLRASVVDGKARLFSAAPLTHADLFVSIGVAESDYLEGWWKRSTETATTTAGMVVLVFGLGLMVVRRIGSQEATERALRAGERRLSQALEGARDAVWDWDLATREVFLSPAWDRIVGRVEPRPARMSSLTAQIHPDDLPAVNEAMAAHLRGETTTYEVIHRIRHGSGRWIWLQVRGRAVRARRGGIDRIVGTATDVTERKSAEEMLAASEQRFRDVVDAMADWAWETDAERRVTWMADSVERVIGIPVSWHIGRRREELDIIASDPASLKAMHEAMAELKPFRDLLYARRTPTGVRWIQASGVPHFDPEGRFAGYRGTARDVTDLRRAQHLLRDAVESIPAGVLLFDAEDRLVLTNQRNNALLPGQADLHRWGGTFEEMLRGALARGLLPEALPDPERWLRARMERHRAADGAVLVHYDDRILEVFEHRTHDGGCLMLRFDVTERERLGERLRQAKDAAEAANRAKSQFLANMSHELRTPLNAIIGFAQLLEGELLGPLGNPRYREYAGDIRDSGEHLLAIIADILDLSRVEAGRMVLE
ncbi:MAG: PAS domain S-box protein, partial [Alphaproteobacteria bacterium]